MISLLFRLGPSRSASTRWRRTPCFGSVVVEKTLLNRNDFRALKLVLIVFTVVEADDTALLTDPIKHLAYRQDLVLFGTSLDNRHLNVLVAAVGDRDR
jgi:hypothetical protein